MVDGDQIAALTIASATDKSGAFGLPATGEPLSYRAVLLYTVRDERIVCEERIYDLVAVIDRLEKVRIERELRVASDVQRILSPRAAHVGPYYEAVGDSIPCRAIGGDFFEFFALPSGTFGMALGDVSGKGPAAALLASLIQGMLAVDTGVWHSPAATLSRTNEALMRQRIEPRFATLFCATVTDDGRLTYANAGHNPPLLVTARGVQQLSGGGPIVGVFDTATFPEETVQLSEGDLLVMFNDGVTEALDANAEEFGESRLMDCVATLRECSPLDALRGSFRSLERWCGLTPQHDDLTIAVLRYGRRHVP